MTLRNLCKIFFLIVLANPFISFSQQWTQTRGPYGGSVIDMIERNGTILAATLGGVFRSPDNGENWYRSVAGMPEAAAMTVFAQSPTYLYAAGNSEGLFRSSDEGVTWAAVPINLPSVFILKLECIGEDIYIGCEGAGVARSTDMGATFQFANAGYPGSANVVAFAEAGGYLFTGLSGNGGSVGIYRSPTNAINWTQMFVGTIAEIALKGSDLFITAANATGPGVFRSNDFGDTWTEPLPGYNDLNGTLSIYQGDLFTAKDGIGILKSTDDGLSWSAADTGLKPLSAFSFLPGTNGFFVGFERGIARSDNSAGNWVVKSKGLTNTSVTSLFADGNRLYATARTINAGSSDGVFYTDDNGENWTPLSEGLQSNPQGASITKAGDNLVLATSNNGLFVRRPTDVAWIRVPAVSFQDHVSVVLSTGQYVFAGLNGTGEMYRSADYGLTWAHANTGINANQQDQICSLYEKNGVIYAGAFNALYRSTDMGFTWTNSSTGIYPGDDVMGVTSIGNDLYAVTRTTGTYKSTNNGTSWVNVNNKIAQFNSIIAYNGILYAGTNTGNYTSSTKGRRWDPYNDGLLYYKNTLSLAVLNNRLFAGTDQTGVWQQAFSTLPVKLISFHANAINNKYIKTTWTVAEESGIRNYVVQRATAGSTDFIAIGSIPSGNSRVQTSYEFIDRSIERNVDYEYRLKIEDGSMTHYSQIQSAKIVGPDVIVDVTPNPNNGHFQIQVKNYQGSAEITIINSIGQTVYTKIEKGGNNSITVSLNSRTGGIYMVKVRVADEVMIRKFLIR